MITSPSANRAPSVKRAFETAGSGYRGQDAKRRVKGQRRRKHARRSPLLKLASKALNESHTRKSTSRRAPKRELKKPKLAEERHNVRSHLRRLPYGHAGLRPAKRSLKVRLGFAAPRAEEKGAAHRRSKRTAGRYAGAVRNEASWERGRLWTSVRRYSMF
jgi:hypothetical protein